MITLMMELWTAAMTFLTGRIPTGAMSVWDVLWSADAEWRMAPPGQHREGISVSGIRDRLREEEKQAWREAVMDRRTMALAA